VKGGAFDYENKKIVVGNLGVLMGKSKTTLVSGLLNGPTMTISA
jgi:hypothetical protein